MKRLLSRGEPLSFEEFKTLPGNSLVWVYSRHSEEEETRLNEAMFLKNSFELEDEYQNKYDFNAGVVGADGRYTSLTDSDFVRDETENRIVILYRVNVINN